VQDKSEERALNGLPLHNLEHFTSCKDDKNTIYVPPMEYRWTLTGGRTLDGSYLSLESLLRRAREGHQAATCDKRPSNASRLFSSLLFACSLKWRCHTLKCEISLHTSPRTSETLVIFGTIHSFPVAGHMAKYPSPSSLRSNHSNSVAITH
jgi:hypothetical protein